MRTIASAALAQPGLLKPTLAEGPAPARHGLARAIFEADDADAVQNLDRQERVPLPRAAARRFGNDQEFSDCVISVRRNSEARGIFRASPHCSRPGWLW